MLTNSVEALREQAARCHLDAQTIRNKADAEARALTDVEKTSIDTLSTQFDNTMKDIQAAERLDAQAAVLAQVQPRKTAPVEAVRSPITAADDRGTWGFKHTGDFLNAVANSARGIMDPRLVKNAVATYSSEGTPADGGFALPPDFRAGVQTLLDTPDNLFARLDQLQTVNAAITVPVDEDPPWSASGITSATVAEAVAVTPTKPLLKQLVLTLSKYGTLVFVSQEMLADGTNINGHIQRKAGDKIAYQLNKAVYTAITGSGSKIITAKNGEAVGAPAALASIQSMWSKVVVSNFQNRAVWLANPAYMTVLNTYTVGNWPAYLPPGGLSNAPYATLYGRPVLFTETCAAVGTEGDICLFVPDQFYGVTKSDGLRVDVSRDFAFDQDLIGFRFYIRAGAKSKFSAVITRPDTTTASNAVTLITR